jgi:DNA-binding XRE family transcriptional regulator
MDLSHLVDLINAERVRRGAAGRAQSIRSAAETMGITHPALIDILRERVQPSPDTCAKVADYLGASVVAVMQLAGHVPPGPLSMSSLSPAQQEAARLIEDLPDQAWRYAALDQLRRLKQLASERAGAQSGDGVAEEAEDESHHY